MAQMKSLLPVLAALATVVSSAQAETPSEVFDQRILPIFRSENPSSCVQCHLASVDLKDYILPSHEKTFLSLRDQGLIDLEQPSKSKILTLIRMGERDLDEGARLIHEKMRKAEFEAFAAWIAASVSDPKLRDLPPLTEDERARPEKPDGVIRHARRSRVVDSFVRNVWSQRMRCFPCHTPHEIDASNPRHAAAVKKQREFEKKHPELVDRLKIFRETPEATLDYLVSASRDAADGDLPLINVENPQQSLLILKPLSKLPPKQDDGTLEKPSSKLPVSHMGGLKMHRNDHSYKSFTLWLQDYSRVTDNSYTSVEDLPSDNWQGTNRILRLTGAPPDWAVGTIVQMFVHQQSETGNGWSESPIAFTQGTVTPRHMVNGALFLIADEENGDRRFPELNRGTYQVRVYVDSAKRLEKAPTELLTRDNFAGQAQLRARWREGFQQAEVILGRQLNQ